MSNTFLRRVLAVDAIVSAIAGAMLLLGADMLSHLLEIQHPFLIAGGATMIPFVALVSWLALQAVPNRAGVWLVIVLNAVWVAGSIALLVSGIERPNALGYGFVIAQALAVGVLAELEYLGLKRAARTA